MPQERLAGFLLTVRSEEVQKEMGMSFDVLSFSLCLQAVLLLTVQ